MMQSFGVNDAKFWGRVGAPAGGGKVSARRPQGLFFFFFSTSAYGSSGGGRNKRRMSEGCLGPALASSVVESNSLHPSLPE